MINILILEDELIIAQDIAINLENEGYHVVAMAMDFEEGIAAIEEHTVDLILIDINLKGTKTGLDFAQVVNYGYEIPFIFTTSYTDSDTINQAKKLKPLNYLVKPFQKEQLLTAIKIADYKIHHKEDVQELKEDEEQVFYIKDDIFIKDKLKYTRLNLAEIQYLKSEGNYIEIYTNAAKPLVFRSSLHTFLTKVNQPSFLQTHRSYVINLDFLTNLELPFVTIKDTKIPITKKYAAELLKRFKVM